MFGHELRHIETNCLIGEMEQWYNVTFWEETSWNQTRLGKKNNSTINYFCIFYFKRKITYFDKFFDKIVLKSIKQTFIGKNY